MPTIALACGFLGGVALGRWLAWSWEAALLLGAIAALIALWLRGPRVRLAALGCVVLAGGLARAATADAGDSTDALVRRISGPVVIEGIVAAQPEAYGRSQRLTVTVRYLKGADRPVSGDVGVIATSYPTYRFGDRLRIEGTAKSEQRLGGTWPVVRYPRIAVLAHGQGGLSRQPLEDLRTRLAERLALALPEPQAGLAQGIFLGLRSNLPPELNAAFRATGTSHVIAISGQNITIVVGLVSGLLLWVLGRRMATVSLIAFVWAYAALAGAEPPVVRATVMASAYLLGSALGRQTSGLVMLILALAVMAGVDPTVLSDTSFQLSAAAMAGLVLLAPRLQAALSLGAGPVGPSSQGFGPGIRSWLAQNLAVSIAAVAFTWPIIAYVFHSFSWVGVPATLAALPALPFIIVFSTLTAVAGLVSPHLAAALGWLAWLPLTYLIDVVGLFARVPAAGLQIGTLPLLAIVAYYLALAALLWLWSRRPQPEVALSLAIWGEAAPRWRWAVGAAATGVVLVWAMAWSAPGGDLVVRALAVPSGQAVLIDAPGRVRTLVNGGPSAQSLELAIARALPFWDRHVDLAISTGTAAAQLGAQIEVAPRHGVSHAFEASSGEGPLYRDWQARLSGAGALVQGAVPGTLVRLGHRVTGELVPLGPSKGGPGQLGLLVRYGEARVLVAPGPPEASSSDGKPSPQVVFVAGGYEARNWSAQAVIISGAPVPAMQEGTGGQVMMATAGRKDIAVRTDGRRLWLTEGRELPSPNDAAQRRQPRRHAQTQSCVRVLTPCPNAGSGLPLPWSSPASPPATTCCWRSVFWWHWQAG